MLRGGGSLFLGSAGRYVGTGHFGLLDLGDGVQKFSCHYEADLDRGGVSVLDIRPLFWRDGWPVAGENIAAGTYRLESERTGTALELAVEGVPVGGRRGGRGTSRWRPAPAAAKPHRPSLLQEAAQVAATWPAGPLEARLAPYLLQAQQKWSVTPVANAGGYPGSPYFQHRGCRHRAEPCRDGDGELTVAPTFTGAPEQLWRIDQLTDGAYRLMPKAVPGAQRADGALGDRRQFSNARTVRRRHRSPALAAEDAMMRRHDPRLPVVGAALYASARRAGRSGRADDRARRRPPRSRLAPDGFLQRWLILEPIARQRASSPTAPCGRRFRASTSPASSPRSRRTARP